MSGLTVVVCGIAIAGCTSAIARPDFRTPLGARLTSGALTGAPVPLRVDPTARVIRSTAANLPPATYSAEQAARGEQVFDQTCSTCHSSDQFIGQTFVDNWKDRRVWDLYNLVHTTMPLDKPGEMKDQEYLDVVAYLLKANHAAAGADSLRADTTTMRAHKIAVRAQ